MKKVLATLPRLVIPKKGTWYVYYQVRDPITDKMVPVRTYKGFKRIVNITERKEWGAKLVSEIAEKLQAGWSPLHENSKNVVYSDNLEYENFAKTFGNLRKSAKTVKYYLNVFLGDYSRGVKPNTLKTYRSKLRIFSSWIEKNNYGDFDVSAINNKVMRLFFHFLIDELGRDRATVEDYRRVLKKFFDYLIRMDRVKKNPVFDIPVPPKRKDMAARPIAKYDLKILLSSMQEKDPQLFLACMFIYYLALRPGQELRLLKIKDIDFYNRIVIINDENSKTMRRTVDIPDHLSGLCNEYMLTRYDREYYIFGNKGKPGPLPTGKNTLRVRFNNFRDKLCLPDTYKFYSLKHTGGGVLLEAGVTIEEIKNHFGHQSIETTDRYLKRHFGIRNEKVIKKFPRPY